MAAQFAKPVAEATALSRPHQRWPGWLISVAIHIGLFFLLLSTMKGCGGNPQGVASEQFRSFGVFVKDPAEDLNETPTENNNDTTDDQTADVTQSNPIDAAPPKEIDLPETALSNNIGPGPPPLPAASVNGDLPREISSGGPILRSSLGLGPGETSFIDIRDSGKRFVYIIDCSESMHGAPIRFAKTQLKTSLRLLQRDQSFHVVFYNTGVRMLQLRHPTKGLYPATERNIAEAVQRIERVQPDAGTRHIPALKRALELRPEVIFFLTDGSDDVISTVELARLKTGNGGRTRIHCIEFGEGDGGIGLQTAWMHRLSSQNGGQHKYINTEKLPRRRP